MDQHARQRSGDHSTYDAAAAAPRVLILSDVRIVRYGLREVLRAAREPWNIAMGASVADAIVAAARDGSADNNTSAATSYDVVLLDMSMTGALEYARELSANPGNRVVGFAAVDSDDALLAYVEAGIVGFVPREGSVADVITTIEGALSGEVRLSPRLAGTIVRRLAELRATREPSPPSRPVALTRREREILRLIDEGLSNKQIAARLVIELTTVKNHVHNILEKTNARRRGEAAALVRRGRPPL